MMSWYVRSATGSEAFGFFVRHLAELHLWFKKISATAAAAKESSMRTRDRKIADEQSPHWTKGFYAGYRSEEPKPPLDPAAKADYLKGHASGSKSAKGSKRHVLSNADAKASHYVKVTFHDPKTPAETHEFNSEQEAKTYASNRNRTDLKIVSATVFTKRGKWLGYGHDASPKVAQLFRQIKKSSYYEDRLEYMPDDLEKMYKLTAAEGKELYDMLQASAKGSDKAKDRIMQRARDCDCQTQDAVKPGLDGEEAEDFVYAEQEAEVRKRGGKMHNMGWGVDATNAGEPVISSKTSLGILTSEYNAKTGKVAHYWRDSIKDKTTDAHWTVTFTHKGSGQVLGVGSYPAASEAEAIAKARAKPTYSLNGSLTHVELSAKPEGRSKDDRDARTYIRDRRKK